MTPQPPKSEEHRDPYGIHILRREIARALEPRTGMTVGQPKVMLDASVAAHALAAYDKLASRAPIPEEVGVPRALVEQAMESCQVNNDHVTWKELLRCLDPTAFPSLKDADR